MGDSLLEWMKRALKETSHLAPPKFTQKSTQHLLISTHTYHIHLLCNAWHERSKFINYPREYPLAPSQRKRNNRLQVIVDQANTLSWPSETRIPHFLWWGDLGCIPLPRPKRSNKELLTIAVAIWQIKGNCFTFSFYSWLAQPNKRWRGVMRHKVKCFISFNGTIESLCCEHWTAKWRRLQA